MKELNETELSDIGGGGDLPASTSYVGPTDAYLATLLALLTPRGALHNSD